MSGPQQGCTCSVQLHVSLSVVYHTLYVRMCSIRKPQQKVVSFPCMLDPILSLCLRLCVMHTVHATQVHIVLNFHQSMHQADISNLLKCTCILEGGQLCRFTYDVLIIHGKPPRQPRQPIETRGFVHCCQWPPQLKGNFWITGGSRNLLRGRVGGGGHIHALEVGGAF